MGLLLALLVAATSPSALVQAFYDHYLAHARAEALAPTYFTPAFAHDYLLVVHAQQCAPRFALIDYDPFFGAQVASIAAVAGAAAVTGDTASVPVKTTLALSKPFPSRMTVKLQRIGGVWLISDFVDTRGDGFRQGLRSMIVGLTDPRSRYSKAERACIDKLR